MQDFREYKAAFLEQNDLAHFGILGMKWGVRRYQNPDGSLTPAGQRRYNENKKFANKINADKKYQQYREKMRQESESKWKEDVKKKEESINNDKKFFDSHASDLFTELDADKNPKRAKAAADLGLEALNRIGRDGYDEDEGITDDDRDWFIWEDQTIGYATLADLALQGKTKSQIKDLMRIAEDLYVGSDENYSNKHGVFQLAEAYGTDEYIDAIFAILNSKGYL